MWLDIMKGTRFRVCCNKTHSNGDGCWSEAVPIDCLYLFLADSRISHPVSMQSVSDLSLSWARGYEEKGFHRMEEITLCHCTKSAPPPITANAHAYTSHTIWLWVEGPRAGKRAASRRQAGREQVICSSANLENRSGKWVSPSNNSIVCLLPPWIDFTPWSLHCSYRQVCTHTKEMRARMPAHTLSYHRDYASVSL